MPVVGVDGCPGGWVAVVYDPATGTLEPQFHPSFQEVIDTYPDADVICVDIPIGLREGPQPRACDIEARKVLLHRRSAVFPTPDPRILDASTYEDARAKSHLLTGKRISLQTFRIFPKLREVNRLMTPSVQDRVFEVHPEVSFWALAGKHPMTHHKSKPEGYEERRALLEAAVGVPIWSREEVRGVARQADPDDVLDATVAAWTARRVAERREGRLPAIPEEDARGLRMEMVY